jgi:hypothetical protein
MARSIRFCDTPRPTVDAMSRSLAFVGCSTRIEPAVKGWAIRPQRREDYREGRFHSSAREAGARGVNYHYEKQIDLAAAFRRVRRWRVMDALDCANFSSERASNTESSPTHST